MLKIFFIIISSLLCLMFLVYKIFIGNKKKTAGISVLVSTMGGVLSGYVLCLIALAIFTPKIVDKAVFLLFAISPFVIGKFATYKRENFYSWLQILFFALSIFYAIII